MTQPSYDGFMNLVTEIAERQVEELYKLRFGSSIKPPVFDQFKASAMAEIARRIRNRALKIEEDWQHFTR